MSRVFRGFKIFGWILRGLFVLLILFVCGVLCWRFCSSGDPKALKTLYVNEQTYGAYAAEGEQMEIFRQEQRSITSGKDNYGYFSATSALFLPSANQVQLTVRYNNATIRALSEDFSLPSIPSPEEELFDVTLLLAIDLTPDNPDDNLTNDPASVRFVRCKPSAVQSDAKHLYQYRRCVFDLADCGEDMEALLDSGLLLAVYTDIYYIGATDYDTTAYGTLCLYDYLGERLGVRLSGKDVKALETWGKEHVS